MSLIPCNSNCVYHVDGICPLDRHPAAGLPALGGACIHFIPSDAKRLGSPHRYSEPGSAVNLNTSAVPPHDKPE